MDCISFVFSIHLIISPKKLEISSAKQLLWKAHYNDFMVLPEDGRVLPVSLLCIILYANADTIYRGGREINTN